MHTWPQFTFLNRLQSLRHAVETLSAKTRPLGFGTGRGGSRAEKKTLNDEDPFPEPGATVSNQSQGY